MLSTLRLLQHILCRSEISSPRVLQQPRAWDEGFSSLSRMDWRWDRISPRHRLRTVTASQSCAWVELLHVHRLWEWFQGKNSHWTHHTSSIGFLHGNLSEGRTTALEIVEQHGAVQQFGKFWHYCLSAITCCKLLGLDRNAMAHTIWYERS